MRIDHSTAGATDDWLETQCRQVEEAGQILANAVGEVNERTHQAEAGALGRRRRITDTQLKQVEQACEALREVQQVVSHGLFDCEHELRSLREREVDPAELLVDGERLIRHYRFLKRRARVIDGLMAYLPAVTTRAASCLEHLRRLHQGEEINGQLRVPDCAFALIALEELSEVETPRK